MAKAVGIIPARLQSSRLPEKVLRPVFGAPMIYHVWNRARQAGLLDDVIVACDHSRIEACVKEFGGKAVMTRRDHPNGSSRIAEAARDMEADFIINIQGDEPLIHPGNIDILVRALSESTAYSVITLGVRETDPEVYTDAGTVKVVCNHKGEAMYFSRSPVPYFRDGGGALSFMKHLGIYGYKKTFLLEFAGWEEGRLEKIEKLEQLRILERGCPVKVIETEHESRGVDTEEDLAVIERKMREEAQKNS